MDIFETIGEFAVKEIFKIKEGALAESASFFIADTIKVFFLLAIMVFLVSIIRTFITQQKIKKLLGGKKEGIGNIIAALLGIPTPFCSCSAVPIFIGFIESGIPLGITFSFLIACPMINEVAVALLLAMFGWKITAMYIGTGLVIAVLAGIIIGRMNLEKEVEDFISKKRKENTKERKMNWNKRIEFAKEQTQSIVQKVWLYIIFGIGIGSIIHGYIPVNFLVDIAGKNSLLAVPIAVMIGIPLYSNAAGTLPIVQALIEKGMAMGTALAFMMSVTALSFPEMIILRRVLKPKLIGIFVGILFVAFVLVGILFNAVLG